MSSAVVVGSGIAGILAALKLKETYTNVILIEREKQCGGFLRSVKNNLGTSFDFGTHIPCETLNSEIDNLLFSNMDSETWNEMEYMNTGNFFAGKLYEKSQFIYTPYLNKEDYEKGLVELLNCTEETDVNSFLSLEAYLVSTYGTTFTEEIYNPIFLKLLGQETNQLSPHAAKIFSASRLIPGEENLCRTLKKIDVYDKKLAYSSFLEGISKEKKYYPKNQQGIGLWIEQLITKCKKENIQILNETFITNIEVTDNVVRKIKLNTGESINIDLLIWSASPKYLLNLLEEDEETKNEQSPLFRRMVLINLTFDEPFLVENHYINCWDTNFKSFRITLYPNITNSKELLANENTGYNCTVEVLLGEKEDAQIVNHEVIKELELMGIISSTATILYHDSFDIKNSFPILNDTHYQNNLKINEKIKRYAENILLIGKASGNSFFMSESLIDTNMQINNYLKKE